MERGEKEMSSDEGLVLLESLKRSLSYDFDIFDVHPFYEYGFDIVAKATIENYRTIFNAVKFDRFYSFEFRLVKYLKVYDLKKLKKAIEIVKNEYLKLFRPSSDVIGTVVSLIFLAPLIDSKGIEFVEKFKFQKSFLLGLKGKYEIRIIFFDMKNKKVYTNKYAIPLKVHYEKILKKGVVPYKEEVF